MLTFDQLKKRVGKNLKYYDDTNGWKTSRDVTETDIGDYINEVYLEELTPSWMMQFPDLFRQTAFADSWILTDTVAAGSTGTTLIISGASSFTNGMVGLYVYNETDDATAKITAYTNTTTVTLDTTIGDDWDGDTIYVFGQEFSFGGDTTDILNVERLLLKYDAAANQYYTAELRDKQDIVYLSDMDSQISTELAPLWYLTSLKIAGVNIRGFGIYPKFKKKVTNAIQIDYQAVPAVMSSASDKPIIQVMESLITGATMKAFEKRQDLESAGYWMTKYERAKRRDLMNYRSRTNNVPMQIKLNSDLYYQHAKLI